MFARSSTSRFPLLARLTHSQRHDPKPVSGPRRARVPALAVLVFAGFTGAAVAQTPAAPADAPVADAWDAYKKKFDAPEPWRTDPWYFQTSVATVHFSSDPNHDNNQNLIYGEYRFSSRWLEGQPLVGASFFDNSFGQSSQFVFAGLLWRPAEKVPEFYIKVAAGVIHGYSGRYQNKIPFNSTGYAPGIVPGVGYCYNRICGEMILFGGAGILWTIASPCRSSRRSWDPARRVRRDRNNNGNRRWRNARRPLVFSWPFQGGGARPPEVAAHTLYLNFSLQSAGTISSPRFATTYEVGHEAPVLIHASSSAPRAFCVPGAGVRP